MKTKLSEEDFYNVIAKFIKIFSEYDLASTAKIFKLKTHEIFMGVYNSNLRIMARENDQSIIISKSGYPASYNIKELMLWLEKRNIDIEELYVHLTSYIIKEI